MQKEKFKKSIWLWIVRNYLKPPILGNMGHRNTKTAA